MKRSKKTTKHSEMLHFSSEENAPTLTGLGTKAPWYQGWELTEKQREVFRNRSASSHLAKTLALRGEGPSPIHSINVPKLDPDHLMPQVHRHGLRSLSLFSGGGGLDLGFDRAGYEHIASYELLSDAAETLRTNRPNWLVFSGETGDVRNVDWRQYRNCVDVIHGGPPCQPFSSAGRQQGQDDIRDMFPQFVRAVLEIEPLAFVAENVPALKSKKFAPYVEATILGPLASKYNITQFEISAESRGIPQMRRRFVFVGFRDKKAASKYQPPEETHRSYSERMTHQKSLSLELVKDSRPYCMGAREALGLPDIGFDALAPTIRSGLTGPRHTTSVLSSVAAQRMWEQLQIWPNGVSPTRDKARLFVPSNGHFRLSLADCSLLQGFPAAWSIGGAVYMALGQIGNSVAPPVGYALATSVSRVLL